MSDRKKGPAGLAMVAALISAMFFGLNAVASKLLFEANAPAHFDAVSLFTSRGFWSMLLFLLLALFNRHRKYPRVTFATLALFFVCGLLYGPGTNALIALGASRTSAGHSVLLLSMFPPLAATLAALILREKLSGLRIAAIAIGVIGAAILTLSKSASASSLAGDALIAGFILAWALMTVCIRRLNRDWPPLFVVGVFGTVGGLLLTLIGASLGRLDAILIPLRHFDSGTILWFDLELVLLVSVTGQLLQGLALRTLNVGLVVALTSYGSIAAGMVASFLLLGESMSAGEIVAGLVLITALGLSLAPEEFVMKLLRRA